MSREDFQDSLRTEAHETQHEADQNALYARIETEQNAELAVIGEELHARHEGWGHPQTNDIRRAVA